MGNFYNKIVLELFSCFDKMPSFDRKKTDKEQQHILY